MSADKTAPAFPVALIDSSMALRDWFAGMALQGMYENPFEMSGSYASEAYETADKMMKAREL